MENKNNINSCLMLAANLITPVSLGSIFDSGDLAESGVVVDSHITLLFKRDVHLDFTIDGFVTSDTYTDIKEMLKSDKEDDNYYSVFELFELSKFENDFDYAILRLKEGKWFNILSKFNKELSNLYDVQSDFGDYKPHLSLAKLEKGTVNKYLESGILEKVLKSSLVRFEDITASYDFENNTFKRFNLTNNFNVERFFRERDLENELKED